MYAAHHKADGVAKLLIEANADLDATSEWVRPVGGPGRLHERCMHARAEVQ